MSGAAIGYGPTSLTDTDRAAGSVDDQRIAAVACAVVGNLVLGARHDVFGSTAATMQRPGLRGVPSAIEEHEIVTPIVECVDRLARDGKHLRNLGRMLGIRVATDTATGGPIGEIVWEEGTFRSFGRRAPERIEGTCGRIASESEVAT